MINLGISSERFLEEYYEKQFLFRKCALTYKPVTWKDINTALFAWDPRDGLLQLFKNEKIPIENWTEKFVDVALERSKIVKDIFYGHLRDGATLVLNRLEIKLDIVQDLAMELARFIGEKTVANGYIAFGGEGPFSKHWDTHCVFALQLIGRKHWRVFAPTFQLPLRHQKSKEHKHECPAEPIFDGYLEAGDLLYIPRGWWHEAIPLAGEETFHLAVGVHPMLLTDYIVWSCFKTLPSVVDLRKSIKAEIDEPERLEHALNAAQEILRSKGRIDAFKQEVIASERVVSRFRIELLGRPRATNSNTEFRLNSAYKTSLPCETICVNGHAISLDAVSQRHMETLFSQSTTSLDDIARTATHRKKTRKLMRQLLIQDIITELPTIAAR